MSIADSKHVYNTSQSSERSGKDEIEEDLMDGGMMVHPGGNKSMMELVPSHE